MGSVSLNCQVRSFCNDCSISPYLLFPPILRVLPFPPSFVRLSLLFNLFFPSHLFSLLSSQCFLIRSFAASHLLHFLDYHG